MSAATSTAAGATQLRAWVQGTQKRVFGRRKNNGKVARLDTEGLVLDPDDVGIEEAIQKLERKAYIMEGLIPEVQQLLVLPPTQAKEAYVAALTQYSLVMMLILAALLGTALNPFQENDSSTAVAVYNTLTMIISCACLAGTTSMVLELALVEGTPPERIHSIIARADALFDFGTNMMAAGLQGSTPVIILRAWIGGFDQTQCIVVTVLGLVFWQGNNYVYFRHLQNHWPVAAQRWAKLLMPPVYQEETCHAAIDELVEQLRYLQQPRDKTLSSEQLGACLGKYFSEVTASSNAVDCVLQADQSEFLHILEDEAGGRLAPMMEKLAIKTFEKAVEGKLDNLAENAISHCLPHAPKEVFT